MGLLEDLEERRSAVAEFFRLERNRRRAEIEQGSGRLGELLQAPEDRELRSAFIVWIKGALFGRIDESEIPDQLGLEEFRNMLEKTVQQWNRELREEGRLEGRKEGRLELLLQLLEKRFGPLDPHTLSRVRAADDDQLEVWADRLLTAASLEKVFEDTSH